MKVNTDGVLLGAAMLIKPSDKYLLDIGTGTGTIALMAAQRLSEGDFRITAIDIDGPSAEEAAFNFERSPWKDHLECIHTPLSGFHPSEKFDLIFSNPPYFDNSLKNPSERKADARHTDSLSYRDIFEFASANLSDDGRIALVLPYEEEKRLLREARSLSFHPFRILYVRTTPSKPLRRIIAEFSRHRTEQTEYKTLTIQSEGKYTEEYLSLVGEFYLW